MLLRNTWRRSRKRYKIKMQQPVTEYAALARALFALPYNIRHAERRARCAVTERMMTSLPARAPCARTVAEDHGNTVERRKMRHDAMMPALPPRHVAMNVRRKRLAPYQDATLPRTRRRSHERRNVAVTLPLAGAPPVRKMSSHARRFVHAAEPMIERPSPRSLLSRLPCRWRRVTIRPMMIHAAMPVSCHAAAAIIVFMLYITHVTLHMIASCRR